MPDATRQERLLRYIQRSLSREPGRAMGPQTPLVSSGLIDSLSLVSILAFVEDEFGIVIPDEAATAEAMDTVARIDALIDACGPVPAA